MKVLITGVAGTGKSTIAEGLKSRGYLAFDVDNETDIPYSMNLDTGQKEVIPTPRPEGWRLNHRWVWDQEALNYFFNKHTQEDIFLCGGADNLPDYYALFDKLFVLTADPDILIERLTTRTNSEYGKQDHERDEAVSVQAQLVENIRKLSGHAINTDQPIGPVIEEVIRGTYDN